MSKDIYTKRCYNINSRYLYVQIAVDNNEHFKYVAISIRCPEIEEYAWREHSSKPGSDEFKNLIYKAFELIMAYNSCMFKHILRDIENSENEFYQKGLEMLQKKKERLIQNIQTEYSL